MKRNGIRFRQAEVTRLLKAGLAAGLREDLMAVQIAADGTMILCSAGGADRPVIRARNEWDEVLHKNGGKMK